LLKVWATNYLKRHAEEASKRANHERH
jgi:hypothetical protein